MKNIKLFLLINIMIVSLFLLPCMAQNTKEYVVVPTGDAFSLENTKSVSICYDSTVTLVLSDQQVSETIKNDSLIIRSEFVRGYATLLNYYPTNSVTKVYYNHGVLTQKTFEEAQDSKPNLWWMLSILGITCMIAGLSKPDGDVLIFGSAFTAFINFIFIAMFFHFIYQVVTTNFIIAYILDAIVIISACAVGMSKMQKKWVMVYIISHIVFITSMFCILN